MNSGFLKVCAASPRVTVGGVQQNSENALREIQVAAEKNVKVLVFPDSLEQFFIIADFCSMHQAYFLHKL